MANIQWGREIIKAYGLDYELVEGSEQAMLTMLEDAYRNKRDIVILEALLGGGGREYN